MKKKKRKVSHTKRKKTKKKQRHLLPVLLVAMFALILGTFIVFKCTEDGTYQVVDYSSGTKEVLNTYHHFFLAKHEMKHTDSDFACVLNEDGKIIALNSGIVNLKTKDVTENTTYTIDGTNETGYTNGNYGADALYLDISDDGKQVKMLLSGVTAWVNTEDIQLYFLVDSLHTSYYYVKDGTLMHVMCLSVTDTNADKYGIGPAPSDLKEGTYYYSYDGHYFYESLSQYSSDMRNNTHKNAVNQDPYYNYYQYVPHRSTSSLTAISYNAYLRNAANITDDESTLYNSGSYFLNAQNKYGINASMMFALACNESAYGKSNYALNNNNLFGHAVYDSSPDSANSYTSIESCINAHAYNFIQQGFANPEDERYHGSWFGDKASGINVSYASDPYWGEKAAALYYDLEPDAYKNNELVTFEARHDFDVYSKNGTVLYSYEKGDIVSFLKYKETGDRIQIASEAPIKNNKINVKADYNNAKAYVKKSDLE